MTVKVRGQLAGAGFLLLPGFLGCNSDNLAWRPLGLVEHHLWFTASIASLLLSPSFSGTMHSKVSLSLLATVLCPLTSVLSESHLCSNCQNQPLSGLTAELPFTPASSQGKQWQGGTFISTDSSLPPCWDSRQRSPLALALCS